MKNAPNSAWEPAGAEGGTGSDVMMLASLDQFASIVHGIRAAEPERPTFRLRGLACGGCRRYDTRRVPVDGGEARCSSRSDMFFLIAGHTQRRLAIEHRDVEADLVSSCRSGRRLDCGQRARDLLRRQPGDLFAASSSPNFCPNSGSLPGLADRGAELHVVDEADARRRRYDADAFG